MFILLQTFAHTALEIVLSFSRRSLPHLIITFSPARLGQLARADETHENDRLRRVVNMDLFELPKPSGNITSHRVLLSLPEDEVVARSRWFRWL